MTVAPKIFHYTARTESGAPVNGTIRVGSRLDGIRRLHERHLFVTSMEVAGTIRAACTFALLHRGPRRSSRIAFMRSLSTLVAAGTPLLRALTVSAEQCHDRRFAEALRNIAVDINGGAALSDAMSRRPAEFPETVVAMVRAGEIGGILDEVLERSSAILEQTQSMQRKVAAALTYPAFVLAAALGLLLFLVLVTVPSFAGILTELHGQMPLPTRVLIALSGALRRPETWILASAAVTIAIGSGAALARRRDAVRWLDGRLLRIPAIGDIRRQSSIAVVARTLGTLLQCGVDIAAAMETCAGVVASETYREAVRQAKQLIIDGIPISQALARSRLFDGICVELAVVGEESGTLDATLRRAAEYLEEEVRLSIHAMTAILEPALVLLLGAVVGGVVASVLVPLYAAIGSLR